MKPYTTKRTKRMRDSRRQETFQGFHRLNPHIYRHYVDEAKVLMDRWYGKRKFGAEAPLAFLYRDMGIRVPRDFGKMYAFLAVQNGDLPADAFSFRTHLKKAE